jgi:hypothetical protein
VKGEGRRPGPSAGHEWPAGLRLQGWYCESRRRASDRNVVRYDMHMLAIQTLSRARAALMPVACLLISAVSATQAQQSPGVPSHQERGNLVFEGIPPLDTAMAARLERYQQSRQATFLDWQADGSMLVATRFWRSRAGPSDRRSPGHA